MIFVATKADASANNLGKISIKNITDVSQETYDVIAAYGNKSFTDDQIIAIDDFLIQLKNLPTYSRFSYCVLPILAPATPFLNDNSEWKDTNPCYDIVNKVRLSPGGYNGYVDNHGLAKGATYGNPVLVKLNEPLSVNPNIFTMGIGRYNDGSRMGYLINYSRATKSITFGASTKVTRISFSGTYDDNMPLVAVGSRSATEVHGVVNSEVGVINGGVNEPYATNPYSLESAVAVSYEEGVTTNTCSFVFFCKDYMMTEDELLAVNKIFYDLMVALW